MYQNQCQSLSVPLAQQSVNRTYSSADLDTPRDIIDDISSTLTHTSDQDINNVDDNSETSESQSIDINVTNINNYVPNDCDSLPIDIDEIATKGQEIETEMEGAGDKEKRQRKGRTQKRERARRNDSIATDRVDDTIASRLKRRRKQLQDDDDDENNQK